MPELGLVCQTADETVRFRTITRKRLLTLEDPVPVLKELYEDNLARLGRAFDYCRAHAIRLYRIPCSLFPFGDHPAGRATFQSLKLQDLDTSGLRLVMHPDQFVVLNSDRPEVIENSIHFLELQAAILDGLNLPRSPWTSLILHGGKGDRTERLHETVQRLPDAIRSRLVLENDESSYSSQEILEACRLTGLPMVFDAHHHVIHEKLDSYEDPSVRYYLEQAATTWPDRSWQLTHISNGRSHFGDSAHHDMIHTMPSCYADAPWIEVEAKAKELAIAALRASVNR